MTLTIKAHAITLNDDGIADIEVDPGDEVDLLLQSRGKRLSQATVRVTVNPENQMGLLELVDKYRCDHKP